MLIAVAHLDGGIGGRAHNNGRASFIGAAVGSREPHKGQ